jgi:hypothetical protein
MTAAHTAPSVRFSIKTAAARRRDRLALFALLVASHLAAAGIGAVLAAR